MEIEAIYIHLRGDKLVASLETEEDLELVGLIKNPQVIDVRKATDERQKIVRFDEWPRTK